MTHQEAIDTLASERYLLDEMSGEDRQAFEEHYFSCERCAGDLRSSAAMLEGARRGFAGSSSTGRVLPMPQNSSAANARAWYRSTALPWAAAASLACVAAYQSPWLARSPRQDGAPVALAPVMLHAATRGAETIVPVDPQARVVTVALDVNDAQTAELTYDLATADGRRVASGRTAAPAAGFPLLLLLPAASPSAPVHYILSVHDTGSPARLLGDYRFALSPQ
ncbi:MAG TPA: zf-HC2 domain-containing protein [Vicinamibacterales bacterium]|nr:zf-HC2 domain-containing protein [Vicinamibacterales bacterium]